MANDVLKTLIAEAYGEGPEGMRRVAETIINRAAIRGLTPEQVVRQPKQYTGLLHPGEKVRDLWSDPQAIAAAQAAWELAMQPGDPTGGADHYHTKAVNPSWNRKMPSTGSYGEHVFYASQPIPPGEIPNVVASALDVVPPHQPPTPNTISPDLNYTRHYNSALDALRSAAPMSIPQGFNAGIFDAPKRSVPAMPMGGSDLSLSGMPNAVTPRLANGNSDVMSYWLPDPVNTVVTGGFGSLTPNPSATTAASRIPASAMLPRTQTIPQMAQVYQHGGPTRPPQIQTATLPQIGPIGGPSLNSAPMPAIPSAVTQGIRTANAGQSPQTASALASWLAPTPAHQSDAMRVARSPGQTVAVIPTVSAPVSGGIGQAPKTTVVKSVPANTALAPKPKTPSDNIIVARNPQAPATTVATIPTKTAAGVVPPTLKTSSLSRDSVANTAAGNATVAGLAKKATTPLGTLTAQAPVYQPSNSTMKIADQLPKRPGMPEPIGPQLPPLASPIQVVPNPAAPAYAASKVAPTPLPASARPLQVATMLDTAPPQMRDVAYPRPRPGIVAGAPMGGPVFQFGPAIAPQARAQQRPAQSVLNQILGFGFAPINQQQVAQSAAAGLLNPASFAALSNGSHSYVSSDGAVMPTTSTSGKPRNTYGD